MKPIAQPKFDKAPPSPAGHAEQDRAGCGGSRIEVGGAFPNGRAEGRDIPDSLLFAAHTVLHPRFWGPVALNPGRQNPFYDVPLLSSAPLARRVSEPEIVTDDPLLGGADSKIGPVGDSVMASG